jgi:hypothetical protein
VSVLEFVVPHGRPGETFARECAAICREENSMSTPPSMRPRAQSPAEQQAQKQAKIPIRPPLVKRLPAMTDERLLSLQRAAMQISIDPEHPKHGSATAALPLIDAEIGRRTASLAVHAGESKAGD